MRTRLVAACLAIGGIAIAQGCGSSSDNTSPAGGAAGSDAAAGSSGSGASGGSAGTTSSGGSAGTTSSGGSAGATSSGGSAGATSSGGSAGTTSSGGSAGATSSGGSAGATSSGGSAGTTSSGGSAGTTGSGGGAGTTGSGGGAGTTGSGGSAGTTGSGGSGGASGGSAIKTVFLILMENKAWCEVNGSSNATYINGTLLKKASYALAYRGPNGGNLHPSEPNYIWLEAGDNLGITNDNDPSSNHQSTKDHLVTYMDTAGVTWKSYQEDISGTVCPLTGTGNYAPKHNPNVFFDDATNQNDASYQYCIDHNRPLTDLDTDLTNDTVAQYNFVTPNQCHDMHSSCAPENNEVKQGDNWLKTWIPKIQASAAYKNNGVILITWDEAESSVSSGSACCLLGNCPIGMIALSPLAKGNGYTNTIAYDHSSTLKSVQEIFGVKPLLRAAGNSATKDLADLFTTFP